jgi:hypothetical protein
MAAMTCVALLVVLLLLPGCSTLGGAIRELAKDPASFCASLQSPYGSMVLARAATTGARVTLSGGQCTVEHGVQ